MSRTILTVDDSASIRQMVKLTLTSGGYTVLQAVDGLDGLAQARGVRADLVITDLNMPGLNGLGLIRELRKLSSYVGVPIIFLTTESDAELKKQAKAAGATGWIAKPFQQDQLLAAVRRVLGS
ncbi:response regulator [Lichenicola sp.]|uniref:response regulator n=1 Tax=Lichenicola sp. TaxID=2804529 RepID=UPI003B009616